MRRRATVRDGVSSASFSVSVLATMTAAGLSLGSIAPDGSEESAADIEASAPAAEVHGPFFEDEGPSDTAWATQGRRTKYPVLSVSRGAFCFVEGSHCKASLVLDAGVSAGMRMPAAGEGPDIPFAQFTFRGGFTLRPLMLTRRPWHPWGIGVVGSWSRGTGAISARGNVESLEVASTPRTDAARVGVLNQLWLSQKPYALHLDFTLGAVRSEVLTSGAHRWGTHAELALAWGGWGGMYLAGDFVERDTRVVLGFRGHGIAAGPVIAMAIVGLALGGAL